MAPHGRGDAQTLPTETPRCRNAPLCRTQHSSIWYTTLSLYITAKQRYNRNNEPDADCHLQSLGLSDQPSLGTSSSHRRLPQLLLADTLPGTVRSSGGCSPPQSRGCTSALPPGSPLLCRVYSKAVQGQGSEPSSALPGPRPPTFRALVRGQTQQRSQRGSTSETGSRLQ